MAKENCRGSEKKLTACSRVYLANPPEHLSHLFPAEDLAVLLVPAHPAEGENYSYRSGIFLVWTTTPCSITTIF